MRKPPKIMPYQKNGKTLFKFQTYLGVDPLTGKKVKTTRQGFKTISDAKREYKRILSEFENGERHRRQAETFEDIFQLWVKVYKTQVEPSTFLKTSQLFKNHILLAFGEYNIDKINTFLCQEFIFDIASFKN